MRGWQPLQKRLAAQISRPMATIHVVAKVGRYSYGLGAVALNLAKEQIAQGHDSVVWCLDRPDEVEWGRQLFGLGLRQVRGFATCGPASMGYTPEMERAALAGERPDIVHQHSIWCGLSRVTRQWRKRHRAVTVVAAHGALQPWALKKSAWKKKRALLAYESANLREATCLHACGENEISDYREYSLKNPIALLPNAISARWIESVGDPSRFRAAAGLSGDSRIMLYLSRITPKKGLPMLIESMNGLRDRLKSWILVIAGMDEFGHQRELEAQIRACDLGPHVRFVGPLQGQDKRDAFAAADLFVLPTHSEGSPVVVLEALGAGVPVLTTKGAPWADLLRHDCGWWTDISVCGIHDALYDALALPRTVLAAAGERGRNLVTREYSWTKTASKTIRLYEWLRGLGPTPEFVHLL